MPFLDTLIVRKPDGHVKLLVYKKTTHTDQYILEEQVELLGYCYRNIDRKLHSVM